MTRIRFWVIFSTLGVVVTTFSCWFVDEMRVRRELRQEIAAADTDANAERNAEAAARYTRVIDVLDRVDSHSLVDTGNGLEVADAVRSRALYERGRCRCRMNDVGGALRDFASARASSPERADIPIEIGIALMTSRRWNDAVSAFSDAIVIDPNAGRAYCNRGAARRFAGDLVGARQDLAKAIALEPGNERAHYNLGVIEEAEGHDERALMEYDAAIAAGCPVANCVERHGRLAARLADAVATKHR